MEERKDETLCHEQFVTGNVVIHPTAKIDPSALIGPNVSIGANCVIGAGARIKNSVVFTNSKIEKSAWVSGSIIGWNSKIGPWCRLESLTIVAEDVQVTGEVFLNGVFILPHKAITTS